MFSLAFALWDDGDVGRGTSRFLPRSRRHAQNCLDARCTSILMFISLLVFRSYSKDAGWSVSNTIIRQRMKNGMLQTLQSPRDRLARMLLLASSVCGLFKWRQF